MGEKRAETGNMQFGDDWPGVFLRGDNAAFFAFVLREFLENPDIVKTNPIKKAALEGLMATLSGCRVANGQNPTNTQYCKNFDEVFLMEK